MNSLIISDHAVLRYLERVNGMDLDKVRKEIVPQQLHTALEMANYIDGRYLVGGFMYVIKNKTLVTVTISKNGKQKHSHSLGGYRRLYS